MWLGYANGWTLWQEPGDTTFSLAESGAVSSASATTGQRDPKNVFAESQPAVTV